MNLDMLFWGLLFIVSCILIAKNIYKSWYNKKHNIKPKKTIKKHIVKEDKSKFKLWQMWKNSYIYLVFIKRERAFVSILYILSLLPSVFIFTILIEIFLVPKIPLNDLPTDQGYAKAIKVSGGRNTGDKLKLCDDKDIKINCRKYNFSVVKGIDKAIDGKIIKIWYQHQWRLFWFENRVKRLEYDNGKLFYYKRMKRYSYDYSYQGKRVNIKWEEFSILKIPFIILVFFLGWIYLLNRKELPIHRLNRLRDYQKNKDKK